MYRITFEDNAKFRAFLSINDISSVDVTLGKDSAEFILNSEEIFAKFTTKCIRSISDEDIEFRVSRSLLASMFRDGAIEVIPVDENTVEIVFYSASGKLLYSAQVPLLTVFQSMYQNKLLVLQKGLGERIDSNEFTDIVKLAASTDSPINVFNGIASVITRTNARIYKPVETRSAFALTAKAFSVLRKCSAYFYKVAEYMCTVSDGLLILVSTVRLSEVDEYSMLCGSESPYRSRYVTDIDFSGLITFMSSRKIDASSLFIDVHEKKIIISSESVKYIVPIEFTNERCANGYNFQGFSIPMFVLKQIIMNAGTTYRLAKKDEFISMVSSDGLVVLFN